MMLPGGCLHDPVQSGDFVLLYLYRYDANGGINTGLVTTEFVYFTVGAEANWLQEADSVNLFNLSIDSGNQIALAIGAVWALAFGIKVVARVFHDGKSTEEE
ncbi:MAG: hypothetical protein JWN73_40 [Betaproteobacteria bacterium]|nr:hypothetical protein [Betaproteobacteria bacterium]